jgi:trimeric autotransporter adhesin
LSATGGASGNSVVFTVASGACTLAGATLSYTGVGTCVIAANQAGNANYSAAAQVSANVVVNPATQAITGFNPSSPVALGASPQVLSAVGGASGNPVTFALFSGPCTVFGNVLSYVGGGVCVVTANQAGNANYAAAAQVTANVRVVPSLNIDVSSAANTTKDAATDGLMILRYLAGFTGTAITDNAMDATATRQAADVPAYLASIRGALDVNGDGRFDVAIDGLLIVRFMRGMREATGLFNGVDVGTAMTTGQIEDYLLLLMP